MKVISLGGAGAMGRYAVRDMAGKDSVEKLTIADYNLAEAQKLAGELGAKCDAVQVDADNHAAMVEAIKGYDVALGSIGPFYKYEAKVVKACIDAGVNYVSICDDYDACAAALEMDAEAKAAGLTMIPGCGWTPGITNVLARKGSAAFDDVEEVAVAWGAHAGDTEGKAVTLHTIHIFTGVVPSFQEGRTVWVPAGTGQERLRFPDPVGEIYVYHVGHPEPVTIPRYFNTGTVTLKGGLVEEYLTQLAKVVNKLHLTRSVRQKDVLGAIINAALPYLEKLGAPPEMASACRVDITGKKAGKWQHIALGAVAHMDLLTGLPLSIAGQMIAEGKVTEKGVMGPEAALDPDDFISRAIAGGIKFFQGDAMKEPLA